MIDLSKVTGAFSAISSLRMLGYAFVLLSGLVSYHYIKVSHLEGEIATLSKSVAEKDSSISQLQVKYHDIDWKNTSSQEELKTWKDRYEIDMKSCRAIVEVKKKETSKAQAELKKLQDYVYLNPNITIDKPLPNDFIDILNGGGK